MSGNCDTKDEELPASTILWYRKLFLKGVQINFKQVHMYTGIEN